MCFKPEGSLKKNLPGVVLEIDEFTALNMYDVKGLDQKEASKKMKISQPTFARILASARRKVSSAIVRGEEIRLKG